MSPLEIYLDHLKGEREGALDRFSADVIRVGRNAEFELCFEDLGVSYEHAELRRRDDGDYWVVDRGSTNGTFVNEERAHNARLKDGDVLRFGKKGPIVRFRTSDADPLLAGRAKPAPKPAAVEVGAEVGGDMPSGLRARATSRYQALAEEQLGLGNAGEPAPPPPSEAPATGRRGGEHRVDERPLPAAVSGGGSLVLPAILAFALLASAGITVALYLELDRRDVATSRALEASKARERELETIRVGLEKRLNEEKSADQSALAEARLRVEKLEAELERERREARKAERDAREKIDDLQRRLARATGELAALGQRASETGVWKIIEKRLERSVVLIGVVFHGTKPDGTKVPFQFFGTGFFVTKDGTIATNKHVVEPWKFRALAQQLAQDKIDVKEGSSTTVAWIAGSPCMTPDRRIDLSSGFSTANGTLEKVRVAPDRWTTLSLPGETGPRLMKIHEDNSNDDVALLKVTTGGPFEAVPLRRADAGPLERLDNVMVLGFPAGPAILEKGRAQPSSSFGHVRKIEETIYVSASMIGGNSGGPLLDTEGRAIGIATRVVQGSEGLGICLKIDHVIALLEGGSW